MKKVILLSLLVLCTLVAAHGATSSKKPQKAKKAKIEKTNPTDTAYNKNCTNSYSLVHPTFKGGDLRNFRTWCALNVRYPMEAVMNDIQGTATVSFIVERDGTVSNVKIEKWTDIALNNAAMDVVRKSPKWKPGTVDNKPVRVSYTIPINFVLTD